MKERSQLAHERLSIKVFHSLFSGLDEPQESVALTRELGLSDRGTGQHGSHIYSQTTAGPQNA